jgi:flagellar hook-length control protein FliK
MNDMRIPPGLLTGAPARDTGRDPGRNESSATPGFDRVMDNARQPAAAPAARDNAPEPARLRTPQRETPRNNEQRPPERSPAQPLDPRRADGVAPRRDAAPATERAGGSEQPGSDNRKVSNAHVNSGLAERAGAATADVTAAPAGAGDEPSPSLTAADAAAALASVPVTAPNLPIDLILRELQAATAALAAASDALAEPSGGSAPPAAPAAAALLSAAQPDTGAALLPAAAPPQQADAGPPAGYAKTLEVDARVPSADAGAPPADAGPGPADALRLLDGAAARTPAASALAATVTTAAAGADAGSRADAANRADARDAAARLFEPTLATAVEPTPEHSSRDRLLEDFERRFERSLAAAAGRPDGFTTGMPQALATGLAAAGVAPGAGAAAAYSLSPVSIAASVGQPAFTEELSHRVLLFAGQRVQNAELSLTPSDLGPIKVAIEIHGQEASLAFTAQHAGTRAAIEEALPRLREMFAGQGLQLTQAQVGDQSRQDPGRPGSDQAGRDRNLAALNAPERSSAVGVPAAGAAGYDARGLRIIDIRV